ncbi:hypothetical protein AVME950_02255 [Acidovorax sp. SUPP950]|uniref:hypothetical protein n=1 Tax=Acidovorax sp. SUPP950 TaxID=511901 RepID=UPI0023BD540A|nr:hypothetical protein [Acidovorax sp. SUPP950]GKS73669.1 hypothetical protein AVME950_02255 [Acidovorax sp. SUPP950]
MKFHAPTHDPLHVALTSGHTAVVTHEGVTLDPMFHREAVARGAVPESMFALAANGSDGRLDLGALPQHVADSFTDPNNASAARSALIRSTLTQMMDGSNEGDFNADGKPNLNRLKARLGFEITREEADAAFEDVAAG